MRKFLVGYTCNDKDWPHEYETAADSPEQAKIFFLSLLWVRGLRNVKIHSVNEVWECE